MSEYAPIVQKIDWSRVKVIDVVGMEDWTRLKERCRGVSHG